MPVTVDQYNYGPAATGGATGLGQQRKLFFAKSLYWIFYSDGSDLVWKTSSDAINWGSATVLKAGELAGGSFSVVLDGDYVHYAYSGWWESTLYYRRGLLNSDGSITWDSEQTVYNVANTKCWLPVIALDSDGYPWIGWNHHEDASGNKYPYVTKSSTKDGTWTTDTGFPVELKAVSHDWWMVVPLQLTNAKMYILYGHADAVVYGRLYDGTMGSEENASSSNVNFPAHFDGIAEDDDVHLVFEKGAGADYFIYVKRTYGVGWGSEQTIHTKPGGIGFMELFSLTRDSDRNIIYAFYVEGETKTNGGYAPATIYLLRNVAGTWETTATEICSESSCPESTPGPNQFLQKYGRSIGVAWLRGDASPYDVRYDILTLLPSSLKSNSHTL
jgi:hypothetical protein